MSKGAKQPASVPASVPVEIRTPTQQAMIEAHAKATLRPSVNAAAVIEDYAKSLGSTDLCALIGAMAEQASESDIRRAEAMLICQAHALQAIFMNLARRATKQEYLKQWEGYLRMALKAQNQCRMTLETLATIKNPPVVFARQANINNGGQQQVNNGTGPVATSTPAGAHTANSANAQTELLEASHGERLDIGTAGKAVGADSHLAPVGKVHRPAYR